MMSTLTIPVLPCASLPETTAFYRALGFDITHEQTRPNVYAATQLGELHLHFAGVEKGAPAAGGTCLALVPSVEPLHAEFSARLRQAYGAVPFKGQPRISRMKKGQSRFTLVDVSGNSIVFIRAGATDDYDEGDAPPPRTSLERALQTAARLRDFKNDDAAAAKLLDTALRKNPEAPARERLRALAARAEIALALGEGERARQLRAELDALELTPEDRAAARRELEALEALERELR